MPIYPASDYPPLPPTLRTLRRCEVTALAILYWPLEEADNAVDVAFLESGWATGAWNRAGEDSRGVWQINVGEGAHPAYAGLNLWDPQVNAYFAHQIWQASGWRAWYNSATKLGLI